VAEDNTVDVLIAGAGIVGLAHAYEAARRGLRVHVVERDHRAAGASVRNFGHVCISGQVGSAFDYAVAGRAIWLEVGRRADFEVGETGTVVVARVADELAVLEEYTAHRPGWAQLLGRRAVADRVPVDHDGVVGGAFLPNDLRIDQREAVVALAAWLTASPTVTISWATSLHQVEPGMAHTSRGPVRAEQVVICVNHDVDRLFPQLAQSVGLARCRLRMLQVINPSGRRFDPAILTGTSLLRYPAFAQRPGAPAIRERLVAEDSPLLTETVNLMVTQRPDGDLVIGGTHHDAATHDPFCDEALDQLLLDEAADLFRVDHLPVRARWTGTYAAMAGEFLIAEPAPGVQVVSVTSGIGMTTAFGLASAVIDQCARGPG
jgi:FAD dependent oxidoreductase TIGR03364